MLKSLAAAEFGNRAEVRLFGSRTDDAARGGDVDLFVEVSSPIDRPALRSARLAARAIRALGGRRVDVVLAAPNLANLPIHDIARSSGVRL
ncbi:MAG: nucleotidyltransferase domain-containing protein [Pseudomonadota bacterium]